MEITGTIIAVLPVREGVSQQTGTAWRMQDYVLQQKPMSSYEVANPKHFVFTVRDGSQGRIARLNIQRGREYKVFFDINAQEYQGKWFNQITAWDARDAAMENGTAVNGGNQGQGDNLPFPPSYQ